MRIDGSSFGSMVARPGGGGGKRSRIEQQIKQLEEKKQRLLDKITGKGGKEESSAGQELSSASVKNNASASATGAAPAAQVALPSIGASSGGGSGSAAVAAASSSLSSAASGIASASAAASASASASGGLRMQAPERPARQPSPTDDIDANADPKEIMKLIQAIDAQILALRAQLAADESIESLPEAADAVDVSSAAALAEQGMQARAEEAGGLSYRNEFGDSVDISAEAMALSNAQAASAGAADPAAL